MSADAIAFLSSWSFEPVPAIGLLVLGALYAVGWSRLRRRGHGSAAPGGWRVASFCAGWLALVLALLSPIAGFDELFFFMHMSQHLLLITFAPPLLLLGTPLVPLLWGLPRQPRRWVGWLFSPSSPLRPIFHFLTAAPVALTLYLVTIAVWHVPGFYDAAQGETATHDFEHLAFLGTALLYWWPVVHPSGGRRRLSYGAAIPYLIAAALEGTVIGALLTFAPTSLYVTYQRAPRLWGIAVLQDQQLGGLLMWVLGGLLDLLPVLILVALMLREGESARSADLPDPESAELPVGHGETTEPDPSADLARLGSAEESPAKQSGGQAGERR